MRKFARLIRLVAVAALLVLPAGIATAEVNDIFVTASSSVSVKGTSTLSTSITIPAGSNCYLTAGVSLSKVTAGTTVTFNGTPMLFYSAQDSANTDVRVEFWYLPLGDLVTPLTGTVVVTAPVNEDIVVGALGYSGVTQAAPSGGACNSNPGSKTNNPNVTAATADRQLVVDVMAAAGNAKASGVGSGQSQQWNLSTGGKGGNLIGAGSTQAGALGGGMSWGLAANANWAICAVTLTPAITPTIVKMNFASATRCSGRVAVRWSTGGEAQNAGFHLLSDAEDERAPKRSGELIAGAALFTRNAVLPNGRSYIAIGPVKEGVAENYWIEAIDVHGRTERYGPFPVVDSCDDFPALSTASPTMASFATSTTGADATAQRLTITAAAATPGPGRRRAVVVADSRQQMWDLAATATLQIVTRAPGWYRISGRQLLAAGLAQPADPRKLQLFSRGTEAAIALSGESDGRLDEGDTLEFYATANDSPESAERVWFLSEGKSAGKRIARTSAPGGDGPSPQTFVASASLRQRSTYTPILRTANGDNFVGPIISTEPAVQHVALPGLVKANGSTARLTVTLQGVGDDYYVVHDHVVRVAVNGIEAGQLTFDAQNSATAEFSVDVAILEASDNVVKFTGSGAPQDLSAVQSTRIDYPRAFVAAGDLLEFTSYAGQTVTLNGFRDANVRLFDITDPSLPTEILVSGTTIGGTFGARFVAAGAGERRYVALTDSKLMTDAVVRANRPSSWHDGQNAASIVIIASSAFIPALVPLQRLRESQGGRVALIDVQDLYDEFNAGEKNTDSIREFLQLARNRWTRPPVSVLLVGDASIDPRNSLGFGDFDFVPTRTVPTVPLLTASDDWFTDFDDDGAADLPIGRLPVRTAADAVALVGKIVAYETSPPAAWKQNVTFVSGIRGDFDFARSAQQAASFVAPPYMVSLISSDTLGNDSAARLREAFASGSFLIDYLGHGSVEGWSDLIGTIHASELANGGKLPIVAGMSCLGAYFQDVYTTSLGESLLLSRNGGAIAVWMSSSLTDPSRQAPMNDAFVAAVTSGKVKTLGEAVVIAKRSATDRDVRASWILLGDPSLRLPLR